ncbi:hypothetical protein QR680_011769 [Steinernema hermaphroditum]|uniref:Peptidase S1 domain-containing protein n=1 Tax=Steinernema hermaphroditum TaxID=289476 RepID=A0AA39I0X1_9BILA|nr:hypothetical protein QR680_011769 [Steinernema hermaphroditum]
MLRIAFFLTLLGISLQSPSNATLEGPDELIFGGSPAAAGQYPFFVSLLAGGYYHSCGGSLISNWHILTAAHCIWHPESPIRVAWRAENNFIQRFQIRLGTNVQGGGAVYRISSAKMHPYYNRFNLNNDIAVITLAAAVQQSSLIQPIRLMRARAGPQYATAIGMGYLRYDPRTRPPSALSPTTLQHVQVTIDADWTCRTRLFPVHMSDFTMCVQAQRAGILPGDSGSPVMVNRGNLWYQVGIVSFSDHMGYIKNLNGQTFAPAGYVRVSSYCPFIAQVTRNMAWCQ